jgi:hypothetical protein
MRINLGKTPLPNMYNLLAFNAIFDTLPITSYICIKSNLNNRVYKEYLLSLYSPTFDIVCM